MSSRTAALATTRSRSRHRHATHPYKPPILLVNLRPSSHRHQPATRPRPARRAPPPALAPALARCPGSTPAPPARSPAARTAPRASQRGLRRAPTAANAAQTRLSARRRSAAPQPDARFTQASPRDAGSTPRGLPTQSCAAPFPSPAPLTCTNPGLRSRSSARGGITAAVSAPPYTQPVSRPVAAGASCSLRRASCPKSTCGGPRHSSAHGRPPSRGFSTAR
jgi:hypothetical protein